MLEGTPLFVETLKGLLLDLPERPEWGLPPMSAVPQSEEDIAFGPQDLLEGCRRGIYEKVTTAEKAEASAGGYLTCLLFVVWKGEGEKSKKRVVVTFFSAVEVLSSEAAADGEGRRFWSGIEYRSAGNILRFGGGLSSCAPASRHVPVLLGFLRVRDVSLSGLGFRVGRVGVPFLSLSVPVLRVCKKCVGIPRAVVFGRFFSRSGCPHGGDNRELSTSLGEDYVVRSRQYLKRIMYDLYGGVIGTIGSIQPRQIVWRRSPGAGLWRGGLSGSW